MRDVNAIRSGIVAGSPRRSITGSLGLQHQGTRAIGAPLVVLGALALFIMSVQLRPDVAIGLVVLGSLFIVLERLRPLRRQPVLRKGFATDCVHFVADEVLAAAIVAIVLVPMLPLVSVIVPGFVGSALGFQPAWLVMLEGLIAAEVAGYWGHRATHEIGWLWRFHAVHHSVETMDWLAPNRRHPIDMAVARLFVIVPMAALGFPVLTVGAHFAIKRFQGLFVHANLHVNAGPLTWLVATPEFHHWHHANHPEAYNKNYAGELPIVDWVFGTLYLPRPGWPERYGCDATLPSSYLGQLAWPFRRPKSDADFDLVDGPEEALSHSAPPK